MASTTIPFYIEMRHLYRGGDRTEHELSFGPIGVAEPTVVVVSSDLYVDPTIDERIKRGVLGLSDRLLDLMAIRCFRLMASLIIEHGGDSGWWKVADISAWIRRAFQSDDAEQILHEFVRHVPSGLRVKSVCLVADDDAI